jgi:hypothetical protein
MRLHFTRFLFACLLIALLQIPMNGKQADSTNPIVFHENGSPLRLNGIVSGVRLYADYVYPKAYIEASRDRLVLECNGRKQIVWNLNQLRGRVRIPDKKAALRYARLYTTPKTFYFFPPGEVEIIPWRELAHMPDYGVESSWHFKPKGSGSFGVLSNRDYRRGRFTPPRVRQIAEGFVINRWTYTIADKVCYVQEFVGRDGAYARRFLKRKQPRLPRINWYLFEGEE